MPNANHADANPLLPANPRRAYAAAIFLFDISVFYNLPAQQLINL